MTPSASDDTPLLKPETAAGPPRKAGYKSWKKKYRKMRIAFERRMQAGEEVFRQEEKAKSTIRRLAIENDRLLDLLADLNNSPQIPMERRIDISMPEPSDSSLLKLEIDSEHVSRKELGIKRLVELLIDVPHLSHTAARESNPTLAADLEPAPPSTALHPPNGHTASPAYPTHFLTPDDIDNYMYAADMRNIQPGDDHCPTLAPLAHPADHPPIHPALQDPNSAINWLRRHAPQIFLQGGHDPGDHHDDHHEGGKTGGGAPRPRKSRKSQVKEEKEGGGGGGESVEDDANGAGKGKRKRDDDGGYRPKGGSSRPVKKKRKSEGKKGIKEGGMIMDGGD